MMADFSVAIQQVQDGSDLSTSQIGELMDTMLCGEASEEAVGDLLLALRDKGEAVSELVGAAQAMRRHMTPIESSHDVLLDTCGTGGSGSGTFNISTATAIVVAATGVAVAKHGNRKATSHSGSADVLGQLGVAIEADVETVQRLLAEVGICFCFAPKLHPAMRHVVNVRRRLKVPTLFNLLGPLCNPAGATHQLLGASTLTAQNKVAAALAELGTQRALVVHGQDGQDEVTLNGSTTAIEVVAGELTEHHWTPDSFGLGSAEASRLHARDPDESAKIIRNVLAGQPGPCRDVVLANAGAALWLVGKTDSLQAGALAAAQAIDTGAATEKLNRLKAGSSV